MQEKIIKRLHKDIEMLLIVDDLDYEKFKIIINNYI